MEHQNTSTLYTLNLGLQQSFCQASQLCKDCRNKTLIQQFALFKYDVVGCGGESE